MYKVYVAIYNNYRKIYTIWWLNCVISLLFTILMASVGGTWQAHAVLYLMSFIFLIYTWYKKEAFKRVCAWQKEFEQKYCIEEYTNE